MTITAAIYILISACIHASWNMFSKSRSPTPGFFLLASLGTVVFFSPVFLYTNHLLAAMPLSVWHVLIFAGLSQAIYYNGLAGAYSCGSMSISYPIARAFPVLLVVLFTSLAGRGEGLSPIAIAGALTIVMGAIILPMEHFHDIRLVNYINPASAFALMAACGTAGYSILDDIGMNTLRNIPDNTAMWQRALLYLVLENTFTALWLQAILLFTKKNLAHFHANWKRLTPSAFLTGVAIGTTYGIILLAMTHVTNVSYVVGLRQISIPIGTILAIAILHEKASLPRLCGSTILFLGLLLISAG